MSKIIFKKEKGTLIYWIIIGGAIGLAFSFLPIKPFLQDVWDKITVGHPTNVGYPAPPGVRPGT
jgi:hypothetical protein